MIERLQTVTELSVDDAARTLGVSRPPGVAFTFAPDRRLAAGGDPGFINQMFLRQLFYEAALSSYPVCRSSTPSWWTVLQ